MKIKIVSGWSNPGGSTTAFINLTNALNQYGIETNFYGPHDYHLQKCSGKKITDLTISKNDNLISHFIELGNVMARKHIFSCHETDVYPLSPRVLTPYRKIHYVSRWQQEWHKVNKPYFILPNILEDLKPNKKPKEKIGGIIGSIDRNKQTHISIVNALNDGCEKILLFGNITDVEYYNSWIKNYIEDKLNYGNVYHVGHVEDKQEMYDSVTDVYQSSMRETWGYVKGECLLTSTRYHSNAATNNFWTLPTEEIIKRWEKEFV
jgi:hypothetical protein